MGKSAHNIVNLESGEKCPCAAGRSRNLTRIQRQTVWRQRTKSYPAWHGHNEALLKAYLTEFFAEPD